MTKGWPLPHHARLVAKRFFVAACAQPHPRAGGAVVVNEYHAYGF